MDKAAVAQQFLDDGQLPAARLAVAEAIAQRDDVADYHLLRGRIELALESPGAAYSAYSNALALDATNGEALLAVAQLGLTTGHLVQSLEAAERISTLAPNQPDGLLVRGIHALIRRRYDQAIELSDRILRDAPGHEGGATLKARAHFMSKRPTEALQVLDAVSKHSPDSAGVSLTRLEIFRALRQPDELGAQFVALRRLRPDDLGLRIDEANFRFKRGERAVAHQLVSQVLANSHTNSATAQLAVALWREYGTHDLPRGPLNEIIDKGNAAGRHILARYFIDQQNVSDAALVISAKPEDPALKARLVLLRGRIAEARDLAMKVLDIDETNCDALLVASEAALRRSNAADALRFAQRAAAECPQELAGWLSAARAYDSLGTKSGVRRIFVQSLDANKQSTVLSASYAEWLISERRPREAIAITRRLTRYAPALLSGWRLYEDLCRRLEQSCLSEARAGLVDAGTRFGIDPQPGEPPPNGLFGRFTE